MLLLTCYCSVLVCCFWQCQEYYGTPVMILSRLLLLRSNIILIHIHSLGNHGFDYYSVRNYYMASFGAYTGLYVS